MPSIWDLPQQEYEYGAAMTEPRARMLQLIGLLGSPLPTSSELGTGVMYKSGKLDAMAGGPTRGQFEEEQLSKVADLGMGLLGILKRSDLVKGGPHFGQWELQSVERRLRPQEYIDARGENRVKMVADMENALQSYGSGQPIANIYWMKHKPTGEVQPFGDDTAHYAMGLSDPATARRKFDKQWSEQQQQWFKDQLLSRGISPLVGGPISQDLNKVREWLLRDMIGRDNATQRIDKLVARYKK